MLPKWLATHFFMIFESYIREEFLLGYRSSNITADILFFITDGKLHNYFEIAKEVEVSYNTVRNHIESLSFKYPIQTFYGGKNIGGVKLDNNFIYKGKVLTNDELQLINKALLLLQKSKSDDVNKALLNKLLQVYSLPNIKRRIENGEREKSL